MPLIMFDILKGRKDGEIKAMLDAAHEAMLEAFGAPLRDRYQIVNEHDPFRMIVQDTGLGISRSEKMVVVRVVTRPRSTEAKTSFYRLLTDKLSASCGIPPDDLVVSLVSNTDEDWSFGLGRAQFLTGEL